ncbi:MAG: bifunctional 2-C-methyl-D-erythritol 4-phosphate cytidylyltransferase/2-C-methyl-D-erythritol 2,4-cyclodiphosphate synthase [Elusimicrobia bacterium CG08_land_8_20_14_0_20_59_10]|nr:MAG: bifunctional 2-C-methyl-D-erythritol 4-phosphate cytidylyltransferase/2-C-methyl-D-erythritol 2,4-cyclodiphosphate synthase [Elusimicrobia bacterium CG08_land_8_20_14_0_20_59_10]
MPSHKKHPGAEAIILAGGSGTRMGADKQYLPLAGRPMIERTVEVFASSGLFSKIILALGPENLKKYGPAWEKAGVTAVRAGPTRMQSLRNSFALVSPGAELVAVHDGARPLADKPLIQACLEKAAEAGASVPAVPLKDTVKTVSPGGKVFESTPDRSALMAVQTPQCYRREVLEKLLGCAAAGKDYSDESQLLEQLGIKAALVPSNYRNIKVTTPEDVLIAEAFMKSEEKTISSRVKTPVARSGFGYDIHRLVEGRPLVLGGVKIEHSKGLLGHSDGDVVLHAVCDALLGSISAGEIGVFFPPTDLTLMGISSVVIAEKTLEVLTSKKARIINVDLTILAEEPKLKPHYENIRASVAKILKLPLADVNVKAKSREGLGDIGHGEAIVCYAVVSVVK